MGGRPIAFRLDTIDPADDLLVPVWRNGELLKRHELAEIKALSQKS